MKLSTGKVAFPIEFDNGDKQTIYFNPNDRGIQERIQGFEKSIEKRIKEIDLEKHKSRFEGDIPEIDLDNPEKLLEMSPEELNVLQDRLNAINEIDKEYEQTLCDEIDDIFNSKVSDIAFRYCKPLDIVIIPNEDGTEERKPYILHFLHWFMVEMKKYGMENKSVMDKYLSKYRK